MLFKIIEILVAVSFAAIAVFFIKREGYLYINIIKKKPFKN